MNPIVNWRELERELIDLQALNAAGQPTRWSYEDLARELANRINERHWRKSKALWNTIQEYRALRLVKNRNDHDRL